MSPKRIKLSREISVTLDNREVLVTVDEEGAQVTAGKKVKQFSTQGRGEFANTYSLLKASVDRSVLAVDPTMLDHLKKVGGV